MPYDRTLISNMTLGHLGVGLTIGDVDNENSAEADACRLFLDHCIQTIIEMMAWPFLTRRVELSELDMDDYPEWQDQWLFIYQYPNFCARPNRIVNPAYRTEPNDEQRIKYKIIQLNDGSGKAILCDEEDAVLEYNHVQSIEGIEGLFTATAAQAVSLLLATMVGKRLRVDASLMQNVTREWSAWQNEAMAQAMDEEVPDTMPISEFQSVRG